jgi:hypothetical protein
MDVLLLDYNGPGRHYRLRGAQPDGLGVVLIENGRTAWTLTTRTAADGTPLAVAYWD